MADPKLHTAEQHTTTPRQPWKQLFSIYSTVFHPFAIPTFCMAALLFGPSYISIMPGVVKFRILAIFILTTICFPLFSIGLLKHLKIIPTSQTHRKRRLPILVATAGYTICYILLSGYLVIGLLPQLLTGAFAVIITCFAVNFFWKISLHMTAIGAAVGLLLCVTMKEYGNMTALCLVFTVLAGGLGTARLYLGKHNIGQVAAGFCIGVGVMLLLCML